MMKLANIRVLDLSRFLPGPYIARMMADQGAEVIKIEPPAGDPTRAMGSPVGGVSTYFRETNRNKKSIVLDLQKPEGREVLLELAARSDVLIESFRPGVTDRLGVSYAQVKQRSSQIVYCSISAFGQTGPRRDTPAHDIGVQALTGFIALGCDTNGTPVLPGVPAADIASGMTAFCGILMALLNRLRTGKGDYIDISMFDSLLAWTPHFADRVFLDKAAPVPTSERWWGGAAFYNIYRTADGKYIALSGTEEKFVKPVLNALGRPDLISHALRPPGASQTELKEYLTTIFLTKTQAQWIDWFDGLNTAFTPVLDLYEAYLDPQTSARGSILSISENEACLTSPLRFAANPECRAGVAPNFGEHTDEMLAFLGYNECARRHLYEAGICSGSHVRR
jgi:crotonobetainyl-CoA:carnitine CoA-transferase CaiB-like acyl-CoA transferase